MTTGNKSGGLAGLSFSPKQHYPNVIDGIYGTFTTPAGQVCYLQTKAKIGQPGSKHSQLTKSLVPAREALNIQKMDFNQLLQRDLDDHRIATKLIPYILNPPVNALPGFYPPVVAVLLPFDQFQQPAANFPPPQASVEHDHEYNLYFRTRTYGKAYRIQFLSDPEDNLQDLPLAVLRWNPDEAKLVIMDGQHRAMSLLAIERTVSNSWHAAQNGKRYAPFYEDHVRKWIDKAKAAGQPVDLSNLELPVTICWFPEEPGQEPRPRPHLAARKLFVDVNNTAKPPSEARLVLLSDTELLNIFARELLNRLRKDEHWGDRFPIFGVEYDDLIVNTSATQLAGGRWSAITSLAILRACVEHIFFAAPRLIGQYAAPKADLPSVAEVNRRVIARLRVESSDSEQLPGTPQRLLRGHMAEGVFPINDDAERQKLLDAFYGRWGKGILVLLSEVLPFRAHLAALLQRQKDWHVVSDVQELAKSALFEDASMYRALQAGYAEWTTATDLSGRGSAQPGPASLKAWELLEQHERPAFCRERANRYLGSDSDEAVKDTNAVLDYLCTLPAQAGLVLTWSYLVDLVGHEHGPVKIAEVLARAINASIYSPGLSRTDRRRSLLFAAPGRQWGANIAPGSRSEPAIDAFFGYWLSLAVNEATLQLWEEADVSPERLRGACRARSA